MRSTALLKWYMGWLDINKGISQGWNTAKETVPKALKPNTFSTLQSSPWIWVIDNAYFLDKNFVLGLNF